MSSSCSTVVHKGSQSFGSVPAKKLRIISDQGDVSVDKDADVEHFLKHKL